MDKNGLDIFGAILKSLSPIDTIAVNSIADLRTRTENVMDQAARLAHNGDLIPLSFYLHTNTCSTMRFIPDAKEIPISLWNHVLCSLCKSNPNVTSIVTVGQGWSLPIDKDDPESCEIAAEWIASGRTLEDHPDAKKVIIVTGAMNITSYGRYNSVGILKDKETKPEWTYGRDCGDHAFHSIVDEFLVPVEDFELLREQQRSPRPGFYRAPPATDWS